MDEKKKLIIVGVLVLVIACVGAFQFLGGSPQAPPAPAPAAKPSTDQSATAGAALGKPGEVTPPVIKNPQVVNELPSRDPFFVPLDVRPQMPRTASTRAPRSSSMPGRFHPLDGGSLKPLVPGGTTLEKISSLPNSGDSKPAEDKPFSYKVVGTIGGVRPEVLIEDSAGNQKLVPEGSAIDGDFRVRSVEKGAVTIEHRGKKLRVTVGGNNPGGK